ncbi:hypothetical protein CS063_10285 [Sporanaerobium hydrogeniformans]|uniref:Uncharacterized protein n=1 Tax=Sporanaerobium hydrogeniformans TaxID=3072179 RepID=A0AC61DCI2_9FIRM|nr:DUF4860 domain-containing protein [Sporanaerobium hydrogeniformans]PHV70468.1 hypothetical protein CS063_10285 [Sporanaerobium hydrogeniformans]
MKAKYRWNEYTSETLLMLTILLLFVSTSFIVVKVGADVYKKIVQDMESHFERSTPLLYIATKIRQNDQVGKIELEQKEGQNVLVITEDLEGTRYETWIYNYEGALYEAFIEKGTTIKLSDGMRIMEIHDLKMQQLENQMLNIVVKDKESKELELSLCLKSKAKQ